MPGTLVKTDGFPSYPLVIRDIGCIHSVVNHSREYVNDVGDHINLIENLWKHLKTEYQTRKGIVNENIPRFVTEFAWRRNYLRKINSNNFTNAFLRLLKNNKYFLFFVIRWYYKQKFVHSVKVCLFDYRKASNPREKQRKKTYL
ncbi:hypothetical protein NGRA_1566 [Nosema granulosis]|uniref:ISXO2-like transposase domain-containing protein n=1 Tax=Nosema granulosis TaxID=83296 RepID=A0A9P6GZ79_9MICR|nr:hypothetical protein NGRA_1566 [Nosema granulosis]